MARREPIGSEGSEDNGFCFARDATTIVMFRVVAAHKVAIDFRDKLLATTQLGKRFVRHYEKNQSELLSVARKDRKLFEDCVNAWVAVAPFVNDMLAPRAGGNKNSKDIDRFSKEDHAVWVGLIGRFRSGSKSKTFLKVLDELEPELGRYVGLSAAEAVQRLRSNQQRK
jgi:hypothetical protein